MAAPSRPDPTVSETLLAQYLRQALGLIEDGQDVVADELCRQHPELAGPLADALAMGDALPVLRQVGAAGDPMAGAVLAERYRLDDRQGMGAMGVVYRATDLELKREVAVKILAKSFPDEVEERRFDREAEVLAALRHPHVVTLHDRGRSERGSPFLVMELLDGASLAAVLARVSERASSETELEAVRAAVGASTPSPESSWQRLAARWAAELAEGLAAAHAVDVFHRDVKPSNVFIRADFSAVLLDFGIAARLGEGRLTLTSGILGTPWYMAPEQVNGEPPSAATDVWGLSATLYHLVTHEPPFSGEFVEVLRTIERRDPRPASALVPGLPRDLGAILEAGMERVPRRRYSSVARLGTDLRAFLAHQPVSVRPLSRVGRAWRRVRRAPAKSLAVAGTTAALVLAGVLLPTWSDLAARERRDAVAAQHARLPVLIALEGQPAERLIAALVPERARTISALDDILALDPGDLPSRLWRAALCLDQGEHEAATRDMQWLAEDGGSDYFAAVATRFLAADPATRGTEAVDLADLPAATTDHERFVAGFLELRNRHVAGFAERAEAVLGAAMATYAPARDLRLIALLALSKFDEAHQEALFLEGRYDRKTARTRGIIGAALVGLKRYRDAVPPLLESLELRPDRHGPLQNLGVAYRRLNQLERAVEMLEQALVLRPHLPNTSFTLAQVHCDRGAFDAALEVAARIPVAPSDTQGWRWRQRYIEARAAYERALSLNALGRREDFAEHVADAIERQQQLAALPDAPGSLRRAARGKVAILEAVVAGNHRAALTGFLGALRQADLDRPHVLELIWSLIPAEGLDPEGTAGLRTWFLSLTGKQRPDDAQLQERLQLHLQSTRDDLERALQAPAGG
ncbi:MAG: protein kinase [Planctomycetota bacterium]